MKAHKAWIGVESFGETGYSHTTDPRSLRREARDGNHIDTITSALGVAGCGDNGEERHPPHRLVDLGR